jgi:RHS repeat-associated protein
VVLRKVARIAILFVLAMIFVVGALAQSPVITSLTPTSGVVGTQVTINGSGFGSTQGSSYVGFNSWTGTVVSWSSTQIVATVPSHATTGPVTVTVGGTASNTNQVFTMPNPAITSLSPNTGAVGSSVTINGSGFGSTQGTSTVKLNGIAATVTSWSATQILVTVPNTVSGNMIVTDGGVASNSVSFTVPAPQITSLSPTSGVVGTQVTINGSGFGATQGSSYVGFNSWTGTVVSWSATQIVGTVPQGATTGPVTVTVNSVGSNTDQVFTMPNPAITSLSPTSGAVGTSVTINGTGFGASQGTSNVKLNGVAATASSWSATQIVATVPNTISGRVIVNEGGVASNGVSFTVPAPQLTSIAPTSGGVGTQVTVNGSGFGTTQGNSYVTFNGWTGNVVSWSGTQIVATVPQGASTGPVTVTVNTIGSNADQIFTMFNPVISSLSPNTGAVGSSVTINGSGFGSTQGTSTVKLNGTAATVTSWSATQIVVTVPNTVSGSMIVTEGGVASSGVTFTVPAPQITSLSPTSGVVGTQVTINGSGFGPTSGTNSSANFNGYSAAIVSWSATQIVATVPQGASTGPVTVTVNTVGSNTNQVFTMPNPVITSLSPSNGAVGSSVTINGSGFGSSQGTSIVKLNGAAATVTTWSGTQIVATVPNATSGSMIVTEGGVASNGVTFTVPAPQITSISPSSAGAGDSVTISGSGFGPTTGTNSLVSFSSGITAATTSWNSNQIVAVVPQGSVTGPVKVYVNSIQSNGSQFTIPNNIVTAVSPSAGKFGAQATVTGSGFGTTQGSSFVSFGGTAATSVVSWSDTQVVALVPTGAASGGVSVTVNSAQSNSTVLFTVYNPVISGIVPPAAAVSATVTLNGSGFIASGADTTVLFNGVQGYLLSWSSTALTVNVPQGVAVGSAPVTVTLGTATSNSQSFTVQAGPTITGVAPSLGQIGSGPITISGQGFGATQSSSSFSFWGATVPSNYILGWSDTAINVNVPPGTSTGPVSVTVGGIVGTGPSFTLQAVSQVTDSLGNQTQYTSTASGGVFFTNTSSGPGCSSCTLRGPVTRATDGNGNMLSSTDELGNTTAYAYDASNNMTSASKPLNSSTTATTSYTYNSFAEVLTSTDALGNTTTNTYDAYGNLLSVTAPAPNSSTAASVTQFSYNTLGELTQITDPNGNATALTYTPVGLIATISDAQHHVTTYQYDAHGNRTAVIDALNNQTSFAYDTGDRLITITYPDHSTSSFTYDVRGRRTSLTDQNGKTTSYAYDDADRLTSVTDPANNTTQYLYDTENNLLSITDANGHITHFTYNARGWVTQTAFPSSLAESYTYDAVGNLTSKTDRKGNTIQYVYDALYRLTQKTYPDTKSVEYAYDLAGKVQQVVDPTGTYGFAYDNMGRVIGTTTQYTFLPFVTETNSYTYDAASNRTSLTAPDGSISTYGYDTLNRLSGLANSWGGSFGFSYDALSRRTQLTRPNGVNTNYSYDSLSHLLSVLHQAGVNTLDGASYTYDPAGNRTSTGNYLNGVTSNYGYDPLYELTQVTQGASTTESYSYDTVGNRLSSSGVPTYSYNASNELTANSLGSYTYDNNGNTLTDATGKSYTWDFENRLTQVVVPGTGTVTFKYDPSGQRIQKSSWLGTTNYLYDGLDLIEELDNGGNVVARYMQGLGVDHALSMLRAGTTVYYQQDGLASVTSLSNSASALAGTYNYDSFGRLSASTGTITNSFQYTGREFDPETGFYEYRARYYDQNAARFMSEDPLRFGTGDTNFYDYVGNRPVTFNDPLGLFPTRWHRDSTYQLAKQIFGPKCQQAATSVADANAAVDYPWWGLANPLGSAWQYGGPHFPIGNYGGVLVSNAIATCSLKSLGTALHTLQDGYSHPSGPLGPALHFFTGTLFDYTGGVNALAALGATRTALQDFKDKCLSCCNGGSDTTVVAH